MPTSDAVAEAGVGSGGGGLTGGEGAGAERARVAVRARPTVTPVSAWTAATPHNCSIFCGFLQDLSATGQGFFFKAL